MITAGNRIITGAYARSIELQMSTKFYDNPKLKQIGTTTKTRPNRAITGGHGICADACKADGCIAGAFVKGDAGECKGRAAGEGSAQSEGGVTCR